MAIFEKKWFRLIIFTVLLVATFVSCAVVLFSDAMAGTNSMGGALMFGMLAVVGQLFLFIAFDMLYGVENGFLRFLRILFIILGALVCVAAGVTSGLFYSLSPMPEVSPWLRGFCGMWLAYGVISFYLYYFADYNFWSDAVIPFIQLIAFAGAYAVTVAFAYVGDAAGDFCYGYPVMISCAVLFIVMCVILKKKGLPFDIDLSLPKITKNTGNKSPVYNTQNDGGADCRREDKSFKALKQAVDKAITSALRSMLGEGQFGRIAECYGGGTNIKSSVSANGSVYVSGTVRYELTSSNPSLNSYDVQNDMQSLIEGLNDYIVRYIEEEADALSDYYFGYENGINIKSDVRIKIK